MKKILTFKEYTDFIKVAGEEQYRRNVSFYNPQEGWVLDLSRKIKDEDSETPKL